MNRNAEETAKALVQESSIAAHHRPTTYVQFGTSSLTQFPCGAGVAASEPAVLGNLVLFLFAGTNLGDPVPQSAGIADRGIASGIDWAPLLQ